MIKSYGWYSALLLATATGLRLSPVGEQNENAQARKSSSHGIDSTLSFADLRTLDFDSHFTKVGDIRKTNEVPVFWHIAKAGGTSMKTYIKEALHFNLFDFSHCLRLQGTQESCALKFHTQLSEGIVSKHALSSMDLLAAAKVLTLSTNYSGRLFTMIRHPVDRVVSLYYHCRVATWETCYHTFKPYPTLTSFVESKEIESNPQTNHLSGIRGKGYDLGAAKQVLQDYVLVGLTEDYAKSANRFKKFFTSPAVPFFYREEDVPHANSHSHPSLHPGEPLWDRIATFVADDIQLYDFAKKLFQEQAHLYQ
mmetsp:Transcript_13963/g.39753  ORF Transcript_13963/g.39753 Transcript_13963/m.39753 type:complete len:309 (+) Transcript_13963:114-1040(+)